MQSFLLSYISQLWILCDVYSMLMWDGRAVNSLKETTDQVQNIRYERGLTTL